MSRANHSCDPNVRMIGDGWPGQLIAVRPIQAQDRVGQRAKQWRSFWFPFLSAAERLAFWTPVCSKEEILLCYGGWDTEFLKEPSTARQKYLSEHWGFQCKCVRCEREASIRTSWSICSTQVEWMLRGPSTRGSHLPGQQKCQRLAVNILRVFEAAHLGSKGGQTSAWVWAKLQQGGASNCPCMPLRFGKLFSPAKRTYETDRRKMKKMGAHIVFCCATNGFGGPTCSNIFNVCIDCSGHRCLATIATMIYLNPKANQNSLIILIQKYPYIVYIYIFTRYYYFIKR